MERELTAAREQNEAWEMDTQMAALERELEGLTKYAGQLERLRDSTASLPRMPRDAARPKVGQPATGAPGRVVVILDRDNRGQKFLEGCTSIPEAWTLHVVYNPCSKMPFLSKPAGDVRYHPSLSNEKGCNEALVAFVAGQVAAEEVPTPTLGTHPYPRYPLFP